MEWKLTTGALSREKASAEIKNVFRLPCLLAFLCQMEDHDDTHTYCGENAGTQDRGASSDGQGMEKHSGRPHARRQLMELDVGGRQPGQTQGDNRFCCSCNAFSERTTTAEAQPASNASRYCCCCCCCEMRLSSPLILHHEGEGFWTPASAALLKLGVWSGDCPEIPGVPAGPEGAGCVCSLATLRCRPTQRCTDSQSVVVAAPFGDWMGRAEEG